VPYWISYLAAIDPMKLCYFGHVLKDTNNDSGSVKLDIVVAASLGESRRFDA
jgi:hypothetical protein